MKMLALSLTFLFILGAFVPSATATLAGQGLEQLNVSTFPSLPAGPFYGVASMTSGPQYFAIANQSHTFLYTETANAFTLQDTESNYNGTGVLRGTAGVLQWSPSTNVLAKCTQSTNAGVTLYTRSGFSLTESAFLTGGCGNNRAFGWTADNYIVWTNATTPYVWAYDGSAGSIQGQRFFSDTFNGAAGVITAGCEICSPSTIASKVDGNVSIWTWDGSLYRWRTVYNLSGTATANDGSMAFSPDGTKLLISIPNNSGSGDACAGKMVVILNYSSNSLTCNPVSAPFNTGNDREGTHRWSPNGEMFSTAQSTGCTATCGLQIQLFNGDVTGTRSLEIPTNTTGAANSGEDSAWDPDGDFFYFTSNAVSPYLFAYRRSDDKILRDWTFAPNVAGTPDQIKTASTGNFTAVAHATTPFVTIFNTSVFPLTQLSNPASLPAGTGRAVAWGNADEFLAVAHSTTPFVTIYQRSGNTFTKLSNPASLPASTGQAVDWNPNAGSHLAVGHATTPFLTVYSRSGTTFTKLTNPATLPTAQVNAVAWSPNGTMLAVGDSGFGLRTYYLSGSTLILQSAPAVQPNGTINALEFGADGSLLVGHSTAPFVSVYTFVGGVYQKAPDVVGGLNALSRPEVSWNPQGNYFIVAANGVPSLNVYSWNVTSLTATRNSTYEIPNAGSLGVEWFTGLNAFSSRILAAQTGTALQGYNTTLGTPPASPGNVQALAGNGNVQLSWNTVSDATGYPVYYATTPGNCGTIAHYTYLTTITGLSYIHGGLTNGQTYYYCVGATGSGGTTFASEVNATPTNSAGSIILSGRAWRANAELSWTTGTYLPVVTYTLYRGNSSLNLTEYLTFNSTIQNYDDPQSPGDCWFYAVQSANGTGESPLSNVLEICYRPPPPPVFGDCGSVWGSDRTEDGNLINCKETLAAQVGMSTLGISVLYGVIMTLAIASGGYMAGKYVGYEWMGSLIAGIIGVAVSMIVGFFPVWLVVFVAVAGTAIILVFNRIRSD
jgi:hypothetical protein